MKNSSNPTHRRINKVPNNRIKYQPQIIRKIKKTSTPKLNDQDLSWWDNLSAVEKAVLITSVVVGGGALVFILSQMLTFPSVAGQSPHQNDTKPSNDTVVTLPHNSNYSHRMFSPSTLSHGAIIQNIFMLPTCPPNAFDELASQFIDRLILTPETKAYYDKNSGLEEKDIQRIEDFIRHAAGHSQSIYCKLESILSSDSFKFELSADDRYLTKNVNGESRPELNRLFMPCGVSEKPIDFAFYTFIHEIHHNSISRSNKQKGNHKHQLSALDLPFGSSFEDMAREAPKFAEIIDKGYKKANNLLQLLQKPKTQLTRSQRELVDKLHRYAEGYVPQLRTTIFSKAQVDGLIAQKFVNSDLSITKKPFAIRVEQSGSILYIDSISSTTQEDDYRISYYTTPPKARSAEKILSDTIALIDHAYTAHDPQKLLTTEFPKDDPIQVYKDIMEFMHLWEADAYIHQVLELHPEILDLIFPNLSIWHRERMDPSQSACLKDSDYISRTQMCRR